MSTLAIKGFGPGQNRPSGERSVRGDCRYCNRQAIKVFSSTGEESSIVEKPCCGSLDCEHEARIEIKEEC